MTITEDFPRLLDVLPSDPLQPDADGERITLLRPGGRLDPPNIRRHQPAA